MTGLLRQLSACEVAPMKVVFVSFQLPERTGIMNQLHIFQKLVHCSSQLIIPSRVLSGNQV